MNLKRNIFPMLAAAVLLASCSQDEVLTGAGQDGLVRVTLSAAATDGVQTRATSTADDPLDRCLIQILEKEKDATEWTKGAVQGMTPGTDGTYTLTGVMLSPEKDYTFLFWADGGESHYAATDLTAVTMAESAQEAGIAYQTKVVWDGSENVEAELTHAVTKVSLNSTTAVPASTTAAVTIPKAYSSFNVLEGTVSGEATTDYTHSGSGTEQTGNQFSFYALVDDETQTLTLNAGGRNVSIANVPLGPDKHVILEGDVAAAGWTTVSFSASMADDWGSTVGLEIADNGSTYIVSSLAALQAWAKAVQSNMSLNCKLAADITLPAVEEEGGSNWTTVEVFLGTFDGQGHTITGLTVAGGLFGTIGSGGKVQNLKLADVKIAPTRPAGAIARNNLSNGTIADCAVEGDVNGAYTAGIGGIVGDNSGTITGCLMEGTVTNETNYTTGGIVGLNQGDVINCHSSATIDGYGYVGGIAGRSNDGGVIIACCSTGEISAISYVGGVVGYGNGGSIICSYATSKITADSGGGVVYENWSSEVIACYYAGSGISGGTSIGGVVGFNDNADKVTACYWSGYDGPGFGSGSGEATKVDGVSVSWSDAVTAMNAALTDDDWEWSLDTTDPNALPTPVKKEAAAGE